MGRKFSVAESVLIDKPVEQVFAYATNYRNDVKWRKGVISMTVEPDGQAWVGTRTVEVIRSFGRKLRAEAEITAFIPRQRADFRSINGPMQMKGSRIFEERGEQTLVTFIVSGELDAIFSLAWPLLRGAYRSQIAADLQRLKHLLETPAPQVERLMAPNSG